MFSLIHRSAAIAALVGTVCTVSSFSAIAQQEPESVLEFTVNGRKLLVREGVELNLDTVKSPRVSVRLAPLKTLDVGELAFDYPRHLSYEFSEEPALKTWTLSGNSLVVLFFEINSEARLSEMLEGMIKKFGRKNCRQEPLKQRFGGRMREGTRLRVTIADQQIAYDCFEIRLADSKTRFVYFQDSMEAGAHSDEYIKGVRIIDESWTERD